MASAEHEVKELEGGHAVDLAVAETEDDSDPCFDYGSLKGCSFLAHTLTPAGQRYALWALRQRTTCPGMIRYVTWLLSKDTWSKFPDIERIVNVPTPSLEGPLTRRIENWPTWRLIADGSLPSGMRRVFEVQLNFELDLPVKVELDSIGSRYMKTVGVFADYLCRKMIHDLRGDPVTERLVAERGLCQHTHWQLYTLLYSSAPVVPAVAVVAGGGLVAGAGPMHHTAASLASQVAEANATSSASSATAANSTATGRPGLASASGTGTGVCWPRSMMPRSVNEIQHIIKRAELVAKRLTPHHETMMEVVSQRINQYVGAINTYRTGRWQDSLRACWQLALLDNCARGGGRDLEDARADGGMYHEHQATQQPGHSMPECLAGADGAIIGLLHQSALRFADTSSPVVYAPSLTVGQCLAECDLIHGHKLIDMKFTSAADLLGDLTQVSAYASLARRLRKTINEIEVVYLLLGQSVALDVSDWDDTRFRDTYLLRSEEALSAPVTQLGPITVTRFGNKRSHPDAST